MDYDGNDMYGEDSDEEIHEIAMEHESKQHSAEPDYEVFRIWSFN